jgi:hypothetical protein
MGLSACGIPTPTDTRVPCSQSRPSVRKQPLVQMPGTSQRVSDSSVVVRSASSPLLFMQPGCEVSHERFHGIEHLQRLRLIIFSLNVNRRIPPRILSTLKFAKAFEKNSSSERHSADRSSMGFFSSSSPLLNILSQVGSFFGS